ncbi:hypothetical protein [Lactiplantibacillus plantarum]|uniref:hypothetical protein n=1 Tax=Lactiplantibacillus plantarum TaxID=1590 RepID=UPI0009381E18|nr:hypothetical protein [Lactiplantibacillus plantarum]APP11249.1 hypothetical protein BSG92_01965 [Lactiplantibacillus plantarum subsp. plantarum]WND29891.1 hypothetical protein RI127_09040 [Lactiplantibacillus plantarum]
MSTKKVQLESPENNPDLGLSKNEPYYPITGVDAVKGLGEKLQSITYQPATVSADGLMSKEDKQKLDSVVLEPLSDIKLKSSDGSIFIVGVTDDGQLECKKEVNDGGTTDDK